MGGATDIGLEVEPDLILRVVLLARSVLSPRAIAGGYQPAGMGIYIRVVLSVRGESPDAELHYQPPGIVGLLQHLHSTTQAHATSVVRDRRARSVRSGQHK